MMAADSQTPEPRGVLRHDEPMSRHTTWRVGGPARVWYQPADLEDLAAFLAGLPEGEEIVWVGLGSNLLVRDGGIPGVVIAPFSGLNRMERLDAGRVRVEAGVSCAKLARFCARQGLAGGEFFAGIPGTVGGALAMNAGAFGGETWERVVAVETLDRHGRIRERATDEYTIGYRTVQGPAGEWFVAAHMEFPAGDTAAAQANVRQLLARRGETQPTSQPSCGSVFRNPQGDHAARLIEACGLKGHCIGGACVSDKHANFIINAGEATAAEIEQLIGQVQYRVAEQFGVELQTEVRIIGIAATEDEA